MSLFPKFIKLLKESDNTRLCGAVNHACDNRCELCPFGSEERAQHVVNSLDVVQLIMGDSFSDNEPTN